MSPFPVSYITKCLHPALLQVPVASDAPLHKKQSHNPLCWVHTTQYIVLCSTFGVGFPFRNCAAYILELKRQVSFYTISLAQFRFDANWKIYTIFQIYTVIFRLAWFGIENPRAAFVLCWMLAESDITVTPSAMCMHWLHWKYNHADQNGCSYQNESEA